MGVEIEVIEPVWLSEEVKEIVNTMSNIYKQL